MIQQFHSWAYIPGKTMIERYPCTPIFIVALLTIFRTWKPPKCPLTEEWIKKMQNTYTMEYYSAIKSNEVMPFIATWIQLESLIPNEVNQKDKDKHNIYYITYLWNLKYGAIEHIFKIETEPWRRKTNLWFPRGEWGGRGVDWEFRVSRCKLLNLEWIDNKILQYNTENSIQSPGVNHNGKEYKRKNVFMCITKSLYCTIEISIRL